MLEAAFTQLAFNKIDVKQQCAFFHETDIGLNEIYTYVNGIVDKGPDVASAVYIQHLKVPIWSLFIV